MYLMESVMELFEIFVGYLANTISFIRIAAFALSHAGLFIAIFEVAKLLKGGIPGTIAAVLVHIIGNLVIICLEGLIVTIQCVRLDYYEFFSKFYEGGGKRYQPIGLKELVKKQSCVEST